MDSLKTMMRTATLALLVLPVGAAPFVALITQQTSPADPQVAVFEVNFQLESGRLTTLPYLEIPWKSKYEPMSVPRALSMRAAPMAQPVSVAHRGRRRRRHRV